jgi:hypothetical protein
MGSDPMPKPSNWLEIGVPAGLPRLYTEHELSRCFGLSSYAMYHLRRLGVVVPVAYGRRSLLYNKETVNWMLARHRIDEYGAHYLTIETEEGPEYVF